MASAFAHACMAAAIGKTYSRHFFTAKGWILGIICTILPDADVLMFRFGVPYEHWLGHRGFSHSLVFALLLGILVVKLFYRNQKLTSKTGLALALFFFLCTASHAVLDALTTGGLGVAFFAPFHNTRYFFPWRPIQVSPIGASHFFSEWGLRVLKSEAVWVGLPVLGWLFFTRLFRRKTNAAKTNAVPTKT